MKYRNGKFKQEHGMIRGLKDLLKSIQQWPEIESIIPGRINRTGKGGKIKLTVQYDTPVGLKALAKGEGAVQELFFVTKEPAILREKLQGL